MDQIFGNWTGHRGANGGTEMRHSGIVANQVPVVVVNRGSSGLVGQAGDDRWSLGLGLFVVHEVRTGLI